MGKKRTHAETKDGSSKPSRDKDRMNDKKGGDKRKNGENASRGSPLVCHYPLCKRDGMAYAIAAF
jgi:ribosome biogenesis protein MAK21